MKILLKNDYLFRTVCDMRKLTQTRSKGDFKHCQKIQKFILSDFLRSLLFIKALQLNKDNLSIVVNLLIKYYRD